MSMTRRDVYAFVEAAVARCGGGARLLEAAVAAMREVRGLPAKRPDPIARELLDDARFVELLAEDDALGQIYQAINAPKLEAAYRAARRDRRKFQDDDIPAVTQLFTPRWVVEFLIEHTLGMTRGGRAMDLRILDPACGTMNFGLVAIDALRRRYEWEIDQAGRPGWPAEPSVRSVDQIPRAIVQHNLFGIDIDPVALELGSQAIEMKLGIAPLHLHRGDALFGFPELDGTFDVVVTNPPFLSARNLPPAVVSRLKRSYPTAWRDTCTCFIERCMHLARPGGGRIGALAMQSFMFTGAFEPFRRMIDQSSAVEQIAHFGPGVFEVGNPGTLQTVAVVLRRESSAAARAAQQVVARRLVDVEQKARALRNDDCRFELSQRELAAGPRGAWVYWVGRREREIFNTLPKLRDIAPPRQGLATTDNARFVRYWWEVASASPGRWYPYAKSGRFRRWYEAPRHRVDWADDGAGIKQSIVERYPYLNGNWSWVAKNASFYGHEGVTYSYLTSGRFSARHLAPGAIFDVAGSSIFPDDPLSLLAILNSTAARALLHAINPTVNFQVGDLGELPVPPTGAAIELREQVARLITLHRQLDTYDETTTDFVAPMPWEQSIELSQQFEREISDLERRVDRTVCELYALDVSSKARERSVFDHVDLARRWVSYRLWSELNDGPLEIQTRPGVGDAIDAAVGGVRRFLHEEFFPWHVKLYRRRPVVWMLGNRSRRFLVRHDRATSDVVNEIFKAVGLTLPRGWQRYVNDGILVNLAPLHEAVCDPTLARQLRAVNDDLSRGRYAWSETYARVFSRASNCGSASVGRRSRPGRRRARPAAECM